MAFKTFSSLRSCIANSQYPHVGHFFQYSNSRCHCIKVILQTLHRITVPLSQICKLTLIITMLAACTTNNYNISSDSAYDSDLPKYYRDSNLNKLYLSFKKLAADNGWHISRMPVTMVFAKTASKEHPRSIGLCSISSGRLAIYIDPTYWNKATIYDREALVYHELGHCFLNRDHCDYRYRDKHKASIMATEFEDGDSKDYKERHDEYLRELFNPDKHCK